MPMIASAGTCCIPAETAKVPYVTQTLRMRQARSSRRPTT